MTLGTFFGVGGGGEDEFSGLHRTHDAAAEEAIVADNCPGEARSDLVE